MSELDDIAKEFLVESYENLDRLDRDFVALETDPTATDRLASIFRTIHTIKGTCGFLGFTKLEGVAHVGENLLSRLRDGQLAMDSEITTGLLTLVDSIREILANIEGCRGEGDKDYAPVINTLRRLNERPAGQSTVAKTMKIESTAPPMQPVDEPDAVGISPASEPPAAAQNASSAMEPVTPHGTANIPASIEAGAKENSSGSVAANAIRVDVGLLDKLMNLVGELVLARNQVLQFNSVQNDPAFVSTTQNLNLITTELQESVMKTRMQPIGSLWDKFPRIVRDLSQACGKKVRIEMEGRDTELDKTILEAIKDPLTHIIRNSVDHGVESPEMRLARNKPEEGRLFMRAFHEGGQVNIEISDDGNGIDPERVKRKAVEKGLVNADHAARMSEREAVALIFRPGFSTAETVTNVSGRGVGMDVVKTNVEKIGGTVDIESRPGQGSTLRIKIPLTLAIIPALVITSGGERFAIPQVSLLELVRLDSSELGVEFVCGAPVFRLRQRLLPLVYLNQTLNLQAGPGVVPARESSNIVVLRAGERQFGLVVDQISDTEEIVVKPLSKQLKGLNVFAGATIMGDGRVALILDVVGLAQKSSVISQSASQEAPEIAENNAVAADRQTLLLFKLRNDQRMAIPLSMVARLEEFPRARIERAGPQQVIQYRGKIMPLIHLSRLLRSPTRSAGMSETSGIGRRTETVQVIVYSLEDRNIGLRVEQILDVVEERVQIDTTGARRGVAGTAVIKDRVTEILDLNAVVQVFEQRSAA